MCMIILQHCCTTGEFYQAYPLIYTFGMLTVIIVFIIELFLLVNLYNALS